MNQRQIGILIIIVGVILAGVVYTIKVKEDKAIKLVINETGSCYLSDGTCLHEDRDYVPYIIGFTLSAALLILGLYLMMFDKTQQRLAENQIKIAEALHGAKIADKEKDEFKAFISGFTEDEQKIIKAVKEQEGIKQSTLRFRTGLSKSTLSLLLKSLEERDIIKRKESGKTNEVYLRKKF